MDEERKRILRMMAEGTISVEECDELLQALSGRRKQKTEQAVQALVNLGYSAADAERAVRTVISDSGGTEPVDLIRGALQLLTKRK